MLSAVLLPTNKLVVIYRGDYVRESDHKQNFTALHQNRIPLDAGEEHQPCVSPSSTFCSRNFHKSTGNRV